VARYNLARVELKTFTFASGSQSLSLDNAVLGRLPKRFLFTVVKNFSARYAFLLGTCRK
jgi:hypothetical protein